MPRVLFQVKRNNSRAVLSLKKSHEVFCIRRKYVWLLFNELNYSSVNGRERVGSTLECI